MFARRHLFDHFFMLSNFFQRLTYGKLLKVKCKNQELRMPARETHRSSINTNVNISILIIIWRKSLTQVLVFLFPEVQP